MQERTPQLQPLPRWFVRSCQWLQKRKKVFWGTLVLGIGLNVFAALLLMPWPWIQAFNGTPLGWALQHPFEVSILGVLLLFFDAIISLGSRLDVGISPKHVKRRYLKRMISETETLTLTGIPAGLIAPGVRLDEVFIPLHLTPNHPLTDYPLTPRELEEQLERRSSSTESEEAERILFEAERSWASTFEEKSRVTLADLWKRLTKEHPAVVLQGYPGMGKSTLMNRLALHMARRSYGRADPTMEVIVQEGPDKSGHIAALLLVFFLLLWVFSRGKDNAQSAKQRLWRERITDMSKALFFQLRLASFVVYVQTRWALYARRKQAPLQLKPFQIPLLVSLSKFATERSKMPDLSLSDYIAQELIRFNIIGLPQFIDGQLQAGHCLILLDGLDEVGDQQVRQQVQEAIKAFIREYCEPTEESPAFNRFMITSRVAGYDQAAFPGVPHYTIAELTDSQRSSFLPRWYQANLRQTREGGARLHTERRQTLEREAATLASALSTAIREHQGLQELAESPFLLTLLAVMQQNRIDLPRQRVELYRTVTQALLENRNLAKGLPTIPEAQAIQRLGPLAFHLQEQGNGFARRKEVETLLKAAIGQEGGSAEEIATELEAFLTRVRERTGLFLQRTADYFGFYHRTFQEYFSARFLINKLGHGSSEEIADLVGRVSHPGDIWREPFLLAVAYKSGEDPQLASELIRALLPPLAHADISRQSHDLFLAAECVIEAKPLTIDHSLQTEIARHLLQRYEEAQQPAQFAVCDQIEAIIRRWLLSVPSTAYRPPIVIVLTEYLYDAVHPTHRRTVLTLLLMIARRLRSAPDNVLTYLTPILLDLAGLTAQGKPTSVPTHLSSSDLLVADLALVGLSFFEARGPAGTYLPELRHYFTLHPEHFRSLAVHSLECHALLTPVVLPQEAEHAQQYWSAMEQWQRLERKLKKHPLKPRDVAACLTIHQTILDCAEEVRFPNTYHLLQILQAEAGHPKQRWQQSWQDNLVAQLASGHYITYQNVALLWLMLFPEEEALKRLITMIGEHYRSGQAPLQQYAQRFLAQVSSIQHYQLDEREQRVRSPIYLIRTLEFLPNLRILRDLRDLLDLGLSPGSVNLPALRDIRSFSDPVGWQWLNPRRVRIDLSVLLPTHDIADRTIQRLNVWCATPSADPQDGVELLTVLLGRMLRLLRNQEVGDTVEQEIEQLGQTILSHRRLVETRQVRGNLQELICYLPARTTKEITLLVRLAEEANERGLPVLCTFPLSHATPNTPEAKQALELAIHSPVEDIRTTVEKRLRQLQQEAATGTSK